MYGYKKAAGKFSIQENIFLTPPAVGDEARVESGKLAMEHFAKSANRPDAIQFFTDMMAVSALQYCQQNDIRVPKISPLLVLTISQLPPSPIRLLVPSLSRLKE